MNMEINQQNLYLILPSKISWLADMMAEEQNVGITNAIKEIYKSRTYRDLEIETTKMWHLGPADLYRELRKLK